MFYTIKKLYPQTVFHVLATNAPGVGDGCHVSSAPQGIFWVFFSWKSIFTFNKNQYQKLLGSVSIFKFKIYVVPDGRDPTHSVFLISLLAEIANRDIWLKTYLF